MRVSGSKEFMKSGKYSQKFSGKTELNKRCSLLWNKRPGRDSGKTKTQTICNLEKTKI
jgi:hypothetical protein